MTTITKPLFSVTRAEILAIVPTPVDAINAMIKGLTEWEQRTDCRVAMQTFGRYLYLDEASDTDLLDYGRRGNPAMDKPVICFGCAATATLFTVLQVDPRIAINRDAISNDLRNFEEAINNLRLGDFMSFFDYYYKENAIAHVDVLTRFRYMEEREGMTKLPGLENTNWKEDLVHYERFAKKLVSYGVKPYRTSIYS